MMFNPVALLATVVVLTASATTWYGWSRWPLVLRRRARWHKARMHAAVRRYLREQVSVGVAATEVAAHFAQWWNLDFATGDEPPEMETLPPGTAMLAPLGAVIAPNGHPLDDPRLRELVERTTKLLFDDHGSTRIGTGKA
jgi:hypothetical protein